MKIHAQECKNIYLHFVEQKIYLIPDDNKKLDILHQKKVFTQTVGG